MTNYTAILDVYSIEDLLELNDITPEECIEYLLTLKYIKLPEVEPLEFE